MSSILQQLENDEAIILMYLADELPAVDRAVVEKRLAADAAFRSKLQAAAASEQEIFEQLGSVDMTQALPSSPQVSQRAVSRLLKQWQVDRLRQPVVASAQLSRGSTWMWLSGAAVAAVLLISWGVWWGIQPDKDLMVAVAPTESSDASTSPTTSDFAADSLSDADAAEPDVLADNNIEMDPFVRDLRVQGSMSDQVQSMDVFTVMTKPGITLAEATATMLPR